MYSLDQSFERKVIEPLLKKKIQKQIPVIDVGELESFVKSVGNHGPKWVSEVLEKNLKTDPELEVARKFVRQLIQ